MVFGCIVAFYSALFLVRWVREKQMEKNGGKGRARLILNNVISISDTPLHACPKYIIAS